MRSACFKIPLRTGRGKKQALRHTANNTTAATGLCVAFKMDLLFVLHVCR